MGAWGLGKLEVGYLEVGCLCDWLGGHIWLSLVCPSWKQGQKLGTLSGINQVPAIWGQVLEVVVWLPGLSQETAGCLPGLLTVDEGLVSQQAVGQSSISIYGLTTVHLYLQSLIILFGTYLH